MDFTTPENLPSEETLWTVCLFDFVVSRTPGREWLYVVPSWRGLDGELAYLAAGGKPLLWPSFISFPALRGPRKDLAPNLPPLDLRSTYRVWKCHVHVLRKSGYSVNWEIESLEG